MRSHQVPARAHWPSRARSATVAARGVAQGHPAAGLSADPAADLRGDRVLAVGRRRGADPRARPIRRRSRCSPCAGSPMPTSSSTFPRPRRRRCCCCIVVARRSAPGRRRARRDAPPDAAGSRAASRGGMATSWRRGWRHAWRFCVAFALSVRDRRHGAVVVRRAMAVSRRVAAGVVARELDAALRRPCRAGVADAGRRRARDGYRAVRSCWRASKTRAADTGARAPAALWLLYVPLLVPQVAFLFGAQVLLVRTELDGTLAAVVWAHLVFVLALPLSVARRSLARVRPALRAHGGEPRRRRGARALRGQAADPACARC